jgi:hypothetical protein
MDPMSAFEQHLARVAAEMAGPVRRVDAMALVRSAQAGPVKCWSVRLRGFGGGATTPTEGGFSMFSALKFVVAAVIVALFGGFLLTGVMTTQPSEVAAPAITQEKDLKAGDWMTPSEAAFFGGGDCSMDVTAAERRAIPSAAGFETRGLPTTCEVTLSDPRLGGTQVIVDNSDCFQRDGCIHWGTMEVVGPDGTWQGWYTGTEFPDGSTNLYIVLTGAGEYEGLVNIRHASGSYWNALEQVGLVYQGPPPPMPFNE